MDAADTVSSPLVAYAKTQVVLSMAAGLYRISEAERVASSVAFRSDWRAISTIGVTQDLVEMAADLADTLALRGFDAVHLASALLISRRASEPAHFMAWDWDLVSAARRMGMPVLGATA